MWLRVECEAEGQRDEAEEKSRGHLRTTGSHDKGYKQGMGYGHICMGQGKAKGRESREEARRLVSLMHGVG